MTIIIGLGSGRSGTSSLSSLLNSQEQSVCFHELNPSCMAWAGTPGPVFGMLREFQQIIEGGPRDRLTIDLSLPNRDEPISRLLGLKQVTTIGEVGSYYLPYVEAILAEYPEVIFPCLRRDKAETIRSFLDKMRMPTGRRVFGLWEAGDRYRNHWVEHDGSRWQHDEVWDKCFPKFKSDTLEAALGEYWDYYYEEATRISGISDHVRIFDLDSLNDPDGQREVLTFCGFDSPRLLRVHRNRIML